MDAPVNNLRAITEALAAELGYSWTTKFFEDDCYGSAPYRAQVVRSDGAGIFLYGPLNENKIYVSGNYPKTLDDRTALARDWRVIPYGEGEHRIGVSKSRDPHGAAKDIARRFMPRYLELYALCVEAKQAASEHKQAQQTKTDALRSIFSAADTRDGREPYKFSAGTVAQGTAEVEAHGKDCMIEFRWIPESVAAELLTVYAKHLASTNEKEV